MFEYHNPKKRSIECVIGRPIGPILVPGGTFVPTLEQERAGVTADVFKPFVSPSFLKPTPPALRRRLYEAQDEPVPEDLIASTSHLAEFGGVVKQEDEERTEEILQDSPRGEAPPTIHRTMTLEEYEEYEEQKKSKDRFPLPSVAPEKGGGSSDTLKEESSKEAPPLPPEESISSIKSRLENASVSQKDKKGSAKLTEDIQKIADAACSGRIGRRKKRKFE